MRPPASPPAPTLSPANARALLGDAALAELAFGAAAALLDGELPPAALARATTDTNLAHAFAPLARFSTLLDRAPLARAALRLLSAAAAASPEAALALVDAGAAAAAEGIAAHWSLARSGDEVRRGAAPPAAREGRARAGT